MKKVIKQILLGLFICLFCNLTIVNAKEETVRTCKYELSNLGSSNTAYIKIDFKKSCSECSEHGYIDLDKSYYFDTKDLKSIKFKTLSSIRTLQFTNNTNPEKGNCPEALFLGVRDGNWVTVNIGTKAEMQKLSDDNIPIGGYGSSYRDRYVITESGILSNSDITAIDNRLVERKASINEKYKEYEDKNCPPYTGDISDGDFLKRWRDSAEIKGKNEKEIDKLLEECQTLKNNISASISSAEDDLKDMKEKGYDINSDAAKNLQNSINTIKNEDSNIEGSGNYSDGKEVTGCEVVPEEIRKWIKISLNFVKYIALVLVIVLGVLDFIKAAGAGEPDSMKKAGQSFIKRLVAVIILFLLPMIVELILHLINLYGSTDDCFGVLK